MGNNGSSFFAAHPLFILDPQSFEILDVNHGAIVRYGYSREEFLIMTMHHLSPGEGGGIAGRVADNDPRKTGEVWVHKTKAGERLYVRFTSHRIDYHGFTAIFAVAHEVTASHANRVQEGSAPWDGDSRGEETGNLFRALAEESSAAEKYKSSIQSFQDLFDSITDAIYIQDELGRFIEVNQGAEEMYGYNAKDFIGKTPEFLAAPGKVDLPNTQKLIQKALDGEPQNFHWWGRRKNGEVFPKEVLTSPGNYFGKDVVITIARDISERYNVEEQIRKSEEMFRQLFQNAPIAIVLMDKRQEIRRVNRAFSEIFGYKTKEIQGLNIDQLIVHEEEKDTALEVSSTVMGGQTTHAFGKRLCKDGGLVDVLIYGVPVIVNGETISIFGIYVDITDRKQAEEKIRKSLKEKEVLLAEIHHRVKNNLAVITGLLELQAYNTDSEEAKTVLKTSQMRVNSIALIHEKLYQNEDLSEISFDIYLEQLTEVITSSLRSSQTDVEIRIEAQPITLTINQAIPCGLILNELITNAYKHAFPNQQEGLIEIVLAETNSKGTVCLQVTDNGVGISQQNSLEQPQSLGLKLINTLSKQLNGTSSFQNRETGTQFKLEFEFER